MRYFILIAAIVSILSDLPAQETDKKITTWLSGQWRTYYLSSFNKGILRDFHGLATGGKVGGSVSLGSFSLNAIGYTSVNLGIQDLSQPDPTTGRLSRYELGLFDVNDPERRWIGLLGEANLTYKSKSHQAIIGRFKLNSPLMNPQDGRMIPTLFQGVWYQFKDKDQLVLESGLINAIAARSTDRYERLEDSFGLYPMGRNPDGSPSDYRNNIRSDFIWISHFSKGFSEQLNVDVWNYYVDNVFNTSYSKIEWNLPESSFQFAVEGILQKQLADGGNSEVNRAYFQSEVAYVLGAQALYQLDKHKFSLGYNHIADQGRFLFPREWGREDLFTFQKRERSDGTANNHALLLTYTSSYSIKKLKIKGIYSLGQQWKPEASNAEKNKYALPSYRHLNLDWFFEHSSIPNLKPELLLTYKQGVGDIPDNPNLIFNKVDLLIVNVIVNYNF